MRVQLDREGLRLVARLRVFLSEPRTVCRVELALGLKGEYELRPRWPWRRVVRETAPPYVLRVSDGTGRTLHEERERLDRFLEAGWSRDRDEARFALRERAGWTCSTTVVLLDLVSREAGAVQLELEVDARGEAETPWSTSWCEVLEADLRVLEGVEPFSRLDRRALPHRTVEV